MPVEQVQQGRKFKLKCEKNPDTEKIKVEQVFDSEYEVDQDWLAKHYQQSKYDEEEDSDGQEVEQRVEDEPPEADCSLCGQSIKPCGDSEKYVYWKQVRGDKHYRHSCWARRMVRNKLK